MWCPHNFRFAVHVWKGLRIQGSLDVFWRYQVQYGFWLNTRINKNVCLCRVLFHNLSDTYNNNLSLSVANTSTLSGCKLTVHKFPEWLHCQLQLSCSTLDQFKKSSPSRFSYKNMGKWGRGWKIPTPSFKFVSGDQAVRQWEKRDLVGSEYITGYKPSNTKGGNKMDVKLQLIQRKTNYTNPPSDMAVYGIVWWAGHSI